MDIKRLEHIKRLVIIAMFSDDDLMELFVLKGGNALDIIHKIALRASVDIDFSIENDFKKEDIEIIEDKIRNVMHSTFIEEGYEVFDLSFKQKPAQLSSDMENFWGGYRVEFKIIESDKYKEFDNDLSALQRNATVVGKNQKKKFFIDISKFEYCIPKEERDLDGYTIYVYTPEMIVLEKIRAICQQMQEYAQIVKSPSQSARARDFFDVYTVLNYFDIDLTTTENIELLINIFGAKRVPLNLIGKIQEYREYHRPDFDAVIATVKPNTDLKDFDFYFDYVVERCKDLESLGEI